MYHQNPISETQQGFTLIELMVVVLIIAVLLSVGLVSLKPNDSAIMRQQIKQFEGAMQQTCDQAAFSQKVMALLPDNKGLQMQILERGKWQSYQGAQELKWHDGIKVKWRADEMVAQAQKLPRPGWICWPSGEVLPGELELQFEAMHTQLSWNAILRFVQK